MYINKYVYNDIQRNPIYNTHSNDYIKTINKNHRKYECNIDVTTFLIELIEKYSQFCKM